MADNYPNELVEVDSVTTSKYNGEGDENTLQLMQEFSSTIIGLSRQIAENNAEKYKAQAEVMIAEIQAKMQEECEEMNGYYNTRKDQEKSFNDIVMGYQNTIKLWTDQLLAEKDEIKIEFLKQNIENFGKEIGEHLDRLANNIAGEQNTRLASSRSRRKGLFGFLKRK